MERKIYWIYILKLWRDEKDPDTYEYYPGYTGRDVPIRFKEHLSGRGDYTKKFPLLQLVYYEKIITTKALVLEREQYFKQLPQKKIEEIIKTMPRTKGTGKMRNKLFDLVEPISLKVDQYQKRYLNRYDNRSEHIRDLISFSMWMTQKGKDLLARLYILCSDLDKKSGNEEPEIFSEIFELFDKFSKRINVL